MKKKLQIIITLCILISGLSIQTSEAKHNKHKDKHHNQTNKKMHNKHGNKKEYKEYKNHNKNQYHSYSYTDKGYSDGLDVLFDVAGVAVKSYTTVDTADSGVLDDSSERADRFIYSQIPMGSSEIEINNLFLNSLNPLKEYYEVNYIDQGGIKKCFRVEESGVIRSIYKKMPCQ